MPVRSLSSSVLKWPSTQIVIEALGKWAKEIARKRDDIQRIGYFGSYARGDWGVGSDLDLLLIVKRCDHPFEERAAKLDATTLPVPADVLVYTTQEWQMLRQERRSGWLLPEVVWIYSRDGS